MKRIVRCTAAFLAFLAAPVEAQAPEDSTDVERPMVPGGVYDKPYLTNLLGRTAIGGYAESHARWEQVDGVRDGLGFELKRWNIFTSTQVSDIVRIGSEVEFEEFGEEITIEYAAVDLSLHPSLTFRAGAILAPIGRFNLSHDSPRNEFTDRPLVSTEVVGTALTEAGLGVLGSFATGGASRSTYELYVVNGFHEGVITDSPDGTRIPFGKKNSEDNNHSPAVTGRLTWSPQFGYEVGASAHYGAYNTFVLDGETVDDRQNLAIYALDAEVTLGNLVVSGEGVVARIEIPAGLQGIYASRQQGFYIQAVQPFGRGLLPRIPSAFLEGGVRLDMVDFDAEKIGDSRRRATVGLNFRPSADAVVKFDYFRERTRDRFNNAGDAAGLLLSVATYF